MNNKKNIGIPCTVMYLGSCTVSRIKPYKSISKILHKNWDVVNNKRCCYRSAGQKRPFEKTEGLSRPQVFSPTS